VTAVAPGTSEITATSVATPSRSGTVTVTVANVEATGVTIDGGDFSIAVGDGPKTLTATVEPASANQAVTWSSATPAVATVDSATGVLTPVAAGTSVITATSVATPSQSGTVTVTVTGGDVEPPVGNVIYEWKAEGSETYTFANANTSNSNMINGKSWTRLGGSGSQTVSSAGVSLGNIRYTIGTVTPGGTGATAADVHMPGTFDLTSPIIIEVDYNGGAGGAFQVQVNNNTTGVANSVHGNTANSAGTTKPVSPDPDANRFYSAQLSDASGTLSIIVDTSNITLGREHLATSTLTFRGESGLTMNVTRITISHFTPNVTGAEVLRDGAAVTSFTLETDTAQLSARALPATEIPWNVWWTSSDAAVATVSGSGLVTKVGPGSTVITARIRDRSTTVAVTVPGGDPLESITIDGGNFGLKPSESKQLAVTAVPATASNAVTWSSADGQIAAVSATGLVTVGPNGRGNSTTITATSTVDTSKTDTVTVTIAQYDDVQLVTIGGAGTQSVEIGNTLNLTVSVTPATANQAVTWTSADSTRVSVSPDGILTAIRAVAYPPAVVITATTVGTPIRTATVSVVVNDPVETVTIVQGPAEQLDIGDTLNLTRTVTPATANQNVTWSLESGDSVTLSGTTVTAVKVGVSVVRATSQSDATKWGEIILTVVDPNAVPEPGTPIYEWKAEGYTGSHNFNAAGRTYEINGFNWTRLGGNSRTVSSAGANFGNVRWTIGATGALDGTNVTTETNATSAIPGKFDLRQPILIEIDYTGGTVGNGSFQVHVNNNTVNEPNSVHARVANSGYADADSSRFWSAMLTEPAGTLRIVVDTTSVSTGRGYLENATLTFRAETALANMMVSRLTITRYTQDFQNVLVNDNGAPVTALTLEVGNTRNLSAETSPASAGRWATAWTTSNPAVATVSAAGVLTALSSGTANITAAMRGVTGTVAVTVANQPPGSGNFTINMMNFTDQSVVHNTMSTTSLRNPETLTVSNPTAFQHIYWMVDGAFVNGPGGERLDSPALTLSHDVIGARTGTRSVTVVVQVNGVLYSRLVTFAVTL